MKKLLLNFFFLIFIFSNSNANEIDLNDPYYKIGWKNLENPENTSIIIPDANASIEIVETEIYLDSKENIKKRLDLINEQETNIEDIYEKLIIFDRDEYYKINIEYNDAGYITSDRFKNFTSSNLLETMNKRMSDSTSKVSWLIEPSLSENNLSTYAYKIEWLDGDITYEYKSLILGREGYIELSIFLFGDGNETEEFFDFYSGIIQEIALTVKFNETYSYSDYQQDDYVSSNTLTNLIDRSYGRGITTDPTSYIAYCLITTSDLKVSKITEADYPRFAGKVINFFVSEIKQEIADISEDGEVNVLSGMYGPGDRQTFKKTEVYTNAYSAAYTNIIELNGDKEGDKVKYEYKNKLQFENGKPVRLYAYIDQTGFSISKWTLKLNCRDYDYTAEEKLVAKKFTPNSNSLKRTTTGTPPPYFFELAEKIKKLEAQGIVGTVEKSENYGWLSKYSLFIEEDFDAVLFFESPAVKKNKSVKIISYGGYKPFNSVYSKYDNLAETFVQPATFKKDGDKESYMKEAFKIKDFQWKFSLRDTDEIVESSNVNYTNNIEAYIASNTSFTVSTKKNNGSWYAGTFKLVNNIEDFHEIYKKNKSTYCSILKEELVKNSENQNIQYNYSDFIDFNKRNNINC